MRSPLPQGGGSSLEMPFAIPLENGQVLCLCCRDHLWHCKSCWDKYHNGKKHKDYITPKYYGQSMNENIDKIMREKYGIDFNPTIKADKSRQYQEGEYH